MERDSRRGRGQWRGCYSFRDMVPEDGAVAVRGHKRKGGLKMGHTYYYYYEVDGSTETHDPAVPSTTACPYLPGQTVNTMSVPMERTLRKRSASLTSMHQFNYRTMNPEAKYITPRPAPPTPSFSDNTSLPNLRHGSAPASLRYHSSSMSVSSRSSSPAPVWKRIFTRKPSNRDIGRATMQEHDDNDDVSLRSSPAIEDARSRSLTPSEGIRTRDMSPESLRRFLSDDVPVRPDSNMSERPALIIPEDIVEENEDDDNFATSATSESQTYPTCLSPPPFKRTASSETISSSINNSSCHTLIPAKVNRKSQQEAAVTAEVPAASDLPQLETNPDPTCFFSNVSSTVTSPVSPRSTEAELELNTFYDSTEEDDDILSCNDGDAALYQTLSAMPSRPQDFEGYSLPREGGKPVASDSEVTFAGIGSPQLHVSMPVSESKYLGSHIDTGLDDFVNELGWMVETIGTRAS